VYIIVSMMHGHTNIASTSTLLIFNRHQTVLLSIEASALCPKKAKNLVQEFISNPLLYVVTSVLLLRIPAARVLCYSVKFLAVSSPVFCFVVFLWAPVLCSSEFCSCLVQIIKTSKVLYCFLSATQWLFLKPSA